MTRLSPAELRQLAIDNPELVARNAQAIRDALRRPLSDDVRDLNPELAPALNDARDRASTLYAQIRMLAPDLFPLLTREYPFEQYRIDIAHVESKLAIEVNGGRWLPGGGKHGTEEDRRKIRRLTLAGWRVLEYSTEIIANDPQGVIVEIRAALAH